MVAQHSGGGTLHRAITTPLQAVSHLSDVQMQQDLPRAQAVPAVGGYTQKWGHWEQGVSQSPIVLRIAGSTDRGA